MTDLKFLERTTSFTCKSQSRPKKEFKFLSSPESPLSRDENESPLSRDENGQSRPIFDPSYLEF